jgi:D-amino-acid oxidase
MENTKTIKRKISIIGAGVIGLTTAYTLSKNHDVTIIADLIGTASDSIKASAMWHVYLVPETEQVLAWAQITLEKLYELSANEPSAGVVLVPGVELFRKDGPAYHIPKWSHIPKLFKFLDNHEIDQYNCYDQKELTDSEKKQLLDNPVTWG